MKKYLPTIIIGGIIAAILVIVVIVLLSPESPKTSKTTVAADPAKLAEGPSQGPADAKVVLTEFGDYQCPACGKFHPILKQQVLPQFEGQIKFVFLNFPLVKIHKNAMAGARAAEAARKQDKFWQMHDKLYESQNEWSELENPNSKFEEYAKQLGLNVDQFKKDVSSQAVQEIIDQNIALGEAFKLEGTPSFFVNGQPVDATGGAEALVAAIKQALAQQ